MIGTLGDTWGRKPAMLFSFGLMGVSVVGLALTPSFASIGWYAPLCAVLFRLLQGFALGGEVGPTTAFLLESAPPGRRGLYVSLQNATQYFATICAGLAGFVLSLLLSPQMFTQWGWRIAMLLGASVVPFALRIRARLPETLHETRARPGKHRGPMGGLLWIALLGLAIFASATIGTYTINYVTTFASHTLGFAPSKAFAAAIAGGSGATVGALLGGVLGDRVGRKPVMVASSVLLLLLTVPCFVLMVQLHTLLALIGGTGCDGIGRRRSGCRRHLQRCRKHAGVAARGRAGHRLCAGDFRLWRHGAIRRHLADRCDRLAAGAGLVHDGRGGAGADGNYRDAGKRA